QVLFIDHMAIDHEEVWPAIEVNIEEKQSKGNHTQGRRGDASAVRLFDEHVGANCAVDTRLAVQRRRLAGKIANGDAELVVVVHIGGIDTHAGIGAPAFIQHQPRLRSKFAKCAMALIDKEQTGREIIGHQDIGPAVIVVIDNGDAEHTRLWRHDAGPYADVLEAPVAEVTVQFESLAAKIFHCTIVFGGGTVRAIQIGLFTGVPVDIRADDQVEPAIAVDIDKGRRRTPAPLGNASLLRDVSEGAVALIAKQPRLSIPSY